MISWYAAPLCVPLIHNNVFNVRGTHVAEIFNNLLKLGKIYDPRFPYFFRSSTFLNTHAQFWGITITYKKHCLFFPTTPSLLFVKISEGSKGKPLQ
jgi:hypothetical protein